MDREEKQDHQCRVSTEPATTSGHSGKCCKTHSSAVPHLRNGRARVFSHQLSSIIGWRFLLLSVNFLALLACPGSTQKVSRQLQKKALGKEMKMLAGGRRLEHTEFGRAKNMGRAVMAPARNGPLCPRVSGWALFPSTQGKTERESFHTYHCKGRGYGG